VLKLLSERFRDPGGGSDFRVRGARGYEVWVLTTGASGARKRSGKTQRRRCALRLRRKIGNPGEGVVV